MGPLATSTEEIATKEAKLDLVKAIKASKDRAWKVLCDQVESDPFLWGTPYKLVMGKLKRHQPIPGLDSPDVVSRIVNALFPTHPSRPHGSWSNIPESDFADASITADEVQLAANHTENNIAPGPDGIRMRPLSSWPPNVRNY